MAGAIAISSNPIQRKKEKKKTVYIDQPGESL